MMQVGPYRVDLVTDGTFALDGGAMFGVVPAPLWRRSHPPDERNRIDMVTRSLLLRGEGRTVLVDTGVGDKLPDKLRDIYRVDHSADDLLRGLAALGVTPEEVTDIVLSHLHFDHCGRLTRYAGDDLELVFPRARHYVQERHYRWASSPSEKDRASFLEENYEPVREAGKLELLDGPQEILPAVELVVLEGHTEAMQGLLVAGDPPLFYPADLVPTSTHLRLPYLMAYDNRPLVTLEEKKRYLSRAAREGWRVVFEHDPRVAVATIVPRGDDYQLGEVVVEVAAGV